jgi:hypothetical protein
MGDDDCWRFIFINLSSPHLSIVMRMPSTICFHLFKVLSCLEKASKQEAKGEGKSTTERESFVLSGEE